ncbi:MULTISPECIES: site-specific integrase [unclassified Bradyrhizobium]|uniref:tyrosine-type recombinase/integrase n=1 Tax=unclassified Bradyrhizobium TaxID=2631580 RepID=UPI002916C9C3|nr:MULTISPECIES: site-specific integrase [unclassified Bradyrhizobium]
MSRNSKGPYLYKRPARREGGKLKPAMWVVRDKQKVVSTGVAAGAAETTPPIEAEQFLGTYIAEKFDPTRRAKDIAVILIGDVLAIYYHDKGGKDCPDPNLLGHVNRLNEFWGDKTLLQVNPKTCRDYVASRPGLGGARRDLEVLRAAINNHSAQNLHFGEVNVTLPPKGEARQEWITRDQAAAIIWAAWRYRETQTIHRGERKGEVVVTDKRPLRHVARFLLIGCYTGTRAGAIASASIRKEAGKSFVDLEAGLFHRLAIGKRKTKKQQPTVPLPPRLLAHMRRWVAKGTVSENFVEYRGLPVKRVKKGFASAVRLAKVDIKVTPHTLRHTAATWLMQAGVDEWQAAGYLGMSVEVLREVYGHHHPDHMKGAIAGITAKKAKAPKQAQSVPQSVPQKKSRKTG